LISPNSYGSIGIIKEGKYMMISTKGRYALRVMLDLAQNKSKEYISLTEISERQGISVKYLELVVSILNRAGYVNSMRGKNGGYKLSRAPEDYTVGAILKLTEGNLSPVNCLNNGVSECKNSDVCLTLPLWKELDNIIDGYLENVTLRDLIK
jgi:Rrf2 family protein